MPRDWSEEDVESFLGSVDKWKKSLEERKRDYSAWLKKIHDDTEEWRKKSHRSYAQALAREQKIREEYYKKASIEEKKYYQEFLAKEADRLNASLEVDKKLLESKKKTYQQAGKLSEYEEKRNEILEKQKKAIQQQSSALGTLNKLENASLSVMSRKEKIQYKLRKAEDTKKQRKEELVSIREKIALTKEELKLATDEETKKAKQAELDKLGAEESVAKKEYSKASKAVWGAQMLSNIGDSLTKAINNTFSKFSNAIDSSIDVITKYQSGAMARMQGLSTSYYGITKDISSSLAVSPYISQQKMLENLNTLIDKGIGFNLEQRAFLATVSDKIATTFDAFDSNLLRLVKLQQADITASRLGMEASLTKFFNSVFKDTSYLSDMYDTVTGAIIEANATMTKEQSTEFEYTVQKWLGSLYSLGLSQQAVSSIAQGIGYLGSGDVQALSGNTALQTLMAMSASRGGVSYAGALTGGLTASDANKLFTGMVEYLREIAENTGTKGVVASAYGNLLGISMSDLRALSNLSTSDIKKISDSMMTYQDTMKEVSSQLAQVSSRIPMGQKIKNVFENLTTTMGSSIAENPGLYTTWLVMSMIEDATGGTKIPMFMGTGIDATVEGLAKLGIVGVGALSWIPKIFSSLSGGSALSLDMFGTEVSTRGTGFAGITQGAGSSEVTYIGSGAGGDIKRQAVSESQKEVSEVKGYASSEQTHDFDDLYEAMFGTEQKSIKVAMDSLSDRFVEEMTDLLSSVNYNVRVTNSGADEYYQRMGLFPGGSIV